MNNGSQQPFKTTNLIFWLTLASVLVMAGVYAYLYVTVRSIGENNAALAAEANTLEGQASQVGQLKQELSLIQTRQPELVSYFIDASDIVPFLETIEGYGRQTNVTTKFNTFVFKKAPDQLAVTLVADGTYTDLYHFMALLEAAPYEISMTSADVSAVNPKGLQATTTTTTATGTGTAKTPTASVPDTWEAQISLSVLSITNVPKDAPKATVPKK